MIGKCSACTQPAGPPVLVSGCPGREHYPPRGHASTAAAQQASLDNAGHARGNVRSMTTHPPATGGPVLPQQRRLVTEIPGPASRALLARREAAVARGVSSILPVFITAAGGGVLVDADGNSLIDFGAGIAVV